MEVNEDAQDLDDLQLSFYSESCNRKLPVIYK